MLHEQTRRTDAQRAFAVEELERLCGELALVGSGLRNAALNTAALRAGHFVGAGALSRGESQLKLHSTALRMGLSAPEARSTIRSGLDAGTRAPAFRSERGRSALPGKGSRVASAPAHSVDAEASDGQPEPAIDAFSEIAESLLALCPLNESPDALGYLGSRGLPTDATPDLFALPPPACQRAVIAKIAAIHGEAAVRATGIARDDLRAFRWPEHRLGIVWRNAYGRTADTLQFRLVEAPRGDAKKVLFCRGRAVRWPFGMHQLQTGPAGTAVLIVEGIPDWLAVHGIYAPYVGCCIALPSAARLRPEWLSQLAGRQVFVALDADEAGERAAAEIIEQLRPVAAPLRVHPFPGTKDWADFAALKTRAPQPLVDDREERAAIVGEINDVG